MMEVFQKIPFEVWTIAFIATWVTGGVLTLLVLAQVWSALRTLRGTAEKREIAPQPLEVKAHVDYATTEELGALAQEITGWKGEIGRNTDQRARDLEGRVELARRELNARMDKMEAQVARGFEGLHERITNFATALNRDLGRLEGRND